MNIVKRNLLCMIAVFLCAALVLAGCQPATSHTHSFTVMKTEAAFMHKAASCTEQAVYYYSCECGERGSQTFADGEFATHAFTEKIATLAYLSAEATTRSAAKYYYACAACKACGTETFEQGEPLQDLPDSVGFMNYDHSILLDGELADGTYTIKYEDDAGALQEYADVCKLTAGDTYTGLIAQNTAPKNATKFGVYNASGVRVGSVAFAASYDKDLGNKLYSFGAISDTHIGYKTAEDDLKKALTYFDKDDSIAFIANCGDLATGGTDGNLTTYKTIVSGYTTKPVYEIAGNHEASRGYLAMDGLKEYTGEDLYYCFTYGNDVYIMIGMYDVHAGEQFSEEELRWLYETLETNRDKRCFVFMHLNPRDGSGDAVDLDLEGDMLSNNRGETFYNLMAHYTNVTWFHGHTHQEFKIQEANAMNTYDNVLGSHSVHIPSLSVPRIVEEDAIAENTAASEGYIVDVYENAVVLRGRDFVSGKFLPIATYCLDTAVETVAENTFRDNAQNIVNANSNALKEADTWYQSSINRSVISKIAITDAAPKFYSECWDASISGNGLIMAYRDGGELFLVCEEDGFYANKNSQKLFAGFTNLKEITGLEKINTANVTDITSAFENCRGLKEIDLSAFNFQYIRNLRAVFKGCTSLTEVKLPQNLGTNAVGSNMYILQSLFEECKSLKTVDMSALSGRWANISNMFKDCTALEEVNFGSLQITAAANTFYNCKALTTANLDGVDFSACDTMLQMFKGCENLRLDCSAWDTTNCDDLTGFNEGAPNVTPPIVN